MVKEFMDSNGVDEIALAYFGTMPPAVPGIKYQVPPSTQPKPGVYAISVNFMMARPHRIREPNGGYRNVGVNEFGTFRQYQPVVTLGGSIDVLHVSTDGR